MPVPRGSVEIGFLSQKYLGLKSLNSVQLLCDSEGEGL